MTSQNCEVDNHPNKYDVMFVERKNLLIFFKSFFEKRRGMSNDEIIADILDEFDFFALNKNGTPICNILLIHELTQDEIKRIRAYAKNAPLSSNFDVLVVVVTSKNGKAEKIWEGPNDEGLHAKHENFMTMMAIPKRQN